MFVVARRKGVVALASLAALRMTTFAGSLFNVLGKYLRRARLHAWHAHLHQGGERAIL